MEGFPDEDNYDNEDFFFYEFPGSCLNNNENSDYPCQRQAQRGGYQNLIWREAFRFLERELH